MLDYTCPVIQTMWDLGIVAKIFNKGRITHIHKGKGDKEDLHNHRGITTSLSIGTIVDSLIDNRIEQLVNFSQA